MYKKWLKFKGLPKKDKYIFCKALIFVPIIHYMIKMKGFFWIKNKLASLNLKPSIYNVHSPKQLAFLINISTGQINLSRICLAKSLLIWWWLKIRGIDSKIIMGISKSNKYDGHAWVEINNEVINDEPNIREKYSVLKQTAK